MFPCTTYLCGSLNFLSDLQRRDKARLISTFKIIPAVMPWIRYL